MQPTPFRASIVLSVLASSAAPQAPCGVQKLVCSAPAANDRFGSALDCDGKRLIVSSRRAAHVFELQGSQWVEVQELVTAEAPMLVAIDADVALVAHVLGPAHVFERSGASWVPSATLEGGPTGFWSIDVSGDTVLIASPDYHLPGGDVRVFDRLAGTWTETGRFRVRSSGFAKFPAVTCKIEGDRCAVGVYALADGPANRGRVWVYEREGRRWRPVAALTPDDGHASDQFGYSLAFERTRLLVGAPGHASDGIPPGGAYVFEEQGGAWVQRPNLMAQVGNESLQFGEAVAFVGERVLIGEPQSGGERDGIVFLYEPTASGWTLENVLGLHPAPGLLYGTAMAAGDDTAFVGSPWDDGSESGAVYAYDFECRPPVRPR